MQPSATHPIALSVVVPAFGGEASLDRCLAAVERELSRAALGDASEVIVRDDATPGGFSEELRGRHPGVRFLVDRRRRGFAGNANLAVEAARGDLVCLLNSDMYPLPGFFERCADAFSDGATFAVTGRILEPSGRDAGRKRLVMRGGRVVVRLERPAPSRGDAMPSPYANGGGSFFRRRIFLELGGFDTAFAPFYWEDADLGYRAWKRGYRILYDPARAVEHDLRGTIGHLRRGFVRRVIRRNRTRFVWHNNTSVGLARLFAETSLVPALRALSRLRLVRAARLLGDAAGLRRALVARRALRRAQVVDDAELARVWRSAEPQARDAGRLDGRGL